MGFSTLDISVFIAYCLLIIIIGLVVSRDKAGHEKTANDYFLAGNSLKWWAIGASLIAANISAEQIIAMSGDGFAFGIAVASYELMAAFTLILVAKYFLPIFIKNKIYTMPQLLELRYNKLVKTLMAVFWIFVYVFVNLTTITYMGARALETIMTVPLIYGIIALVLFSLAYSIYGGLKAVATTDIIQVIFLVLGGLITTYYALTEVSAQNGGNGVFDGFAILLEQVPQKFHLIIDKGEEMYAQFPGIWILVGGLWIANISYWGANQYIIQRALAAKNLEEAQRGLVFAGYLKLLLPLIIVVPGVAAAVLQADVDGPSDAYPWLLKTFVPQGLKGLAFAALIAAIVSSLSSMINSISTIFTMDIYKPFFNEKASDKKLVNVGRIAGASSLILAAIIAPSFENAGSLFQFIQKYTGFISPGIVAIFILGLFWKKTTSNAALAGIISSVIFSIILDLTLPESFPFLNAMGITFLLITITMIIITLLEGKGQENEKAIHIEKSMFKTSMLFNITSIGILLLLTAIYIKFW